jgi:hypothetical protein
MSTPNQISFYDVKNIPEELLNYDYVTTIEYSLFTQDIIVHYKSGTTKNLGSVSPGDIRNISDATIVDGDLIIITNLGNINAGRAVAEYTYNTGNVTGLGLLVDNNGTFKTVTSTDPNITITDNSSALNFDITLGSLTPPDGAPVYSNFAWFRDTAEDFTTISNTWSKRNINQIVVNNLGLTNVDGRITLVRGAYLIKGYTKSYRSTTSYPAIRDAVNNITLLQGMSGVNFNAADSTDCTMTIRGYLNIESTTDIELQMISLIGYPTVGGGINDSFVTDQIPLTNSELMIYKLSDEPFVPVVPDNNDIDDLLFALQQNYYNSGKYSTPSAVLSTLGATLTGTNKWFGSVLGPDGKIYGVPYSSTDILIIDPVTDTATRSAMGANLSGLAKWIGSALGPNGKIYCIPDTATDILIIDPSTGTATRSTMGADFSGTIRWRGACLGSDGNIYGIPSDATDILIINPIAGTATRSNLGADLSGSLKWGGTTLGPDGKIYGIPYNATDVLIIDPIAGTATRSNLGADLSGVNKWGSGTLGPDGKIYCIPRDATDILIIDPITGTATRSNMGADLSGSLKWSGGVLGADGKIYGIPYNSTTTLIIDPIAGTATRSTLGVSISGSNTYGNGILSPAGKIYCIPFIATNNLVISNSHNLTYPESIVKSAYLNRC